MDMGYANLTMGIGIHPLLTGVGGDDGSCSGGGGSGESKRLLSPLNTSLAYACKYTRRIQELLIILQQTCPSVTDLGTKLVAVTPKNKTKQIRRITQITKSERTIVATLPLPNTDSNTPVLSSTGVTLNGVVERRNRTLIEAARTMLIYAQALLFLWAEAVATACFTQNRSIIRIRHGKTPYEILHSKLPDLSFFHVFTALCYLGDLIHLIRRIWFSSALIVVEIDLAWSLGLASVELGIKCSKAFPLLAMKIPLLEYFATKFRIQQYLQNEHYALWEVTEFSDSYKAPPEETCKGPASESSTKKKGKTVVITTEDMHKRRNDVKARKTLLLALPDKHQLRFSKYETAQELWEAILKTFETIEQTFNRLQAIVSHLEFIDVDIKQDDLNQNFLTSLALEWLIHTIVWRNRDDLYTMSLDDVYNQLKVYELEVQKKSESNSQNMAFISSSNTSSGKGEVHTASVPTNSIQVSTVSTDVAAASLSHDTICAYIASQSNGSQIKYEEITLIDEDDIEEMYIKWNIALLSMRADWFWKKIGKKITIQGSDVAGFDKSKVECFNCHKMG
nr:ribonuclease H-like domain-containing protein [Tanacetum cinerariifolium]